MRVILRALPLAAILFAPRVEAGDAIVTLQYENPNAAVAGTSKLLTPTIEAIFDAFPSVQGHVVNTFEGQIGSLSAEELKKNYSEAKAALGQLRMGSVLVLNCHSSSERVGIPTEKGSTELIRWEDLWGRFGIVRPPRLALVVLNGCVGVHNADGTASAPTDEDLDRVRGLLHTEALISGKRNIATEDSQAEIENLCKRLKAEEGVAGKGWDLRLDQGAMAKFRIMCLHQGRFVQPESLSVNGLKHQAMEFGRPGEVASAGATDTVTARADDADISAIGLQEPVRLWEGSDLTTDQAKIPFRFEFNPRQTIVRVEIQLRIHVIAGDGKDDELTFLAPGDHAPLKKDFSEFKKADGDLTLKFPSDDALQANPNAVLADTDPLLYQRLMAGRLRCVIGKSLRVLIAKVVVTYAGK